MENIQQRLKFFSKFVFLLPENVFHTSDINMMVGEKIEIKLPQILAQEDENSNWNMDFIQVGTKGSW